MFKFCCTHGRSRKAVRIAQRTPTLHSPGFSNCCSLPMQALPVTPSLYVYLLLLLLHAPFKNKLQKVAPSKPNPQPSRAPACIFQQQHPPAWCQCSHPMGSPHQSSESTQHRYHRSFPHQIQGAALRWALCHTRPRFLSLGSWLTSSQFPLTSKSIVVS